MRWLKCCTPLSMPPSRETLFAPLLSRRAALVLPLWLAACASDLVETPPIPRGKLDAVRLDRAEATAWLNSYREKSGLAPVRLDPELSEIAQKQADAMASADKVSHEVNGSFAVRLAAKSVSASEAGENVCAGYFSTAAAMEAWRRSPDHDVNLRLRSASRFGIALAKNPHSSWGAFWAMTIASPPPA
jgi:uncharacterized protein YkwD